MSENTIKAWQVHEWCEPKDLKLEDVPQPQLQSDQVLVRVETASLNFADSLIIQGKYQSKPPFPFTPGFELCGTIDRIGQTADASHLKVGQKVMAYVPHGAFAEMIAVDPVLLHPLPEGMTVEEAAAFPLVYQTSYCGLAIRGALVPGETVLIHSAAGGVGLAAVQIARGMGAGKIIGTAGSDAKLNLIREHGCDVAVNYRTEDFVEIVKKETDGRGADVIYDPIGGEVSERSTKCIAFDGRLVVIGFSGGDFGNFRANHILIKNYSVVGLHYGNYQIYKPQVVRDTWDGLDRLYADGALKPLVDKTYPMTELPEAMRFLASRKAVGKIVLKW